MTCTGCPCCGRLVTHCIAKYFIQQLSPVKNLIIFSLFWKICCKFMFWGSNFNQRSCSSKAVFLCCFLIPVHTYCYASDYLSLFDACHLLWSSCRASCVLLSDETIWISSVGGVFTLLTNEKNATIFLIFHLLS